MQKVNSVLSRVRERDFVISLISFLLSQNFPQPSVLRAIMKEKLVLNFPLQRLDVTRRHLAFPFPVGLRLILRCLTSSLPPSSCSHVKTIFPSTDWSVRRFVCVQKMDFTQIFILKFPAIPYSNTFSMIFDFWPIFYISPFVL